MDFVDDIDLEAAFTRREMHFFKQIADFIDAPVGSTVNFKNVQRIAIRNLLAGRTFAARFGSFAIVTIQRLG